MNNTAMLVVFAVVLFVALFLIVVLSRLAFEIGVGVLIEIFMGRNPFKPTEYLKLATYYVTVVEQNADGLHIHTWPSPIEPTRSSIINYLMTETSYEFERDFSIDDLSLNMAAIELQPFTTCQDFVFNRYALAPNRVLTITRVLTLTGVA